MIDASRAPRDDDHELETASLCPKSTWDSCEPQRARAEMDSGRNTPQKYNHSDACRELVHKQYHVGLWVSDISYTPFTRTPVRDPCDGFIELG